MRNRSTQHRTSPGTLLVEDGLPEDTRQLMNALLAGLNEDGAAEILAKSIRKRVASRTVPQIDDVRAWARALIRAAKPENLTSWVEAARALVLQGR